MAQGIQGLVPEVLLPLAALLHFLGQRGAAALYGAAAILGLWLFRRRRESLLVLVGLLAATSNGLVKELIGRPRPDPEVLRVYVTTAGGGYGFPSGDVQLFTIFFGLLFFLAPTLVPRTPIRLLLRINCGLLIALVGPARVALGLHWPSDVLGGYLLGAFILWGLLVVHRRFSPGSGLRGS